MERERVCTLEARMVADLGRFGWNLGRERRRREETIGWPAALLFQAAARGFEDTGGGWGGVEVDGQTRPCTRRREAGRGRLVAARTPDRKSVV